MKKIWFFLLGILVGIVLTVLTLFIIGKIAENSIKVESDEPEQTEAEESMNRYGPSFFNEPGETFDFKSVKVFQVLEKGVALALVGEKMKYINDISYTGMTVLIEDKDALFYDNQIIKVSKNQVFKQIGIYRYPNKEDNVLTVPIVAIFETN